MKTMAQGDNTTETFLEKDAKNDNVPDASDNSADSKLNKEKFDNRSVKNSESLSSGETIQGEQNREVSLLSADKERVKSKPIKLKRKKLEDCHKLLESDTQSSVVKEEQKRKWGERHSRSRSRSSENEETLFFDKKKRAVNQRRPRNTNEDKTSRDISIKIENIESDAKHIGRCQHSDSDSSSDTDNKHTTRKRKIHIKRSESSSSDSSSCTSSSSSSDSDAAKKMRNESSKRKRIDGDKTRSSSAESQSSGKHRKEKSNTSDSSDSHTASRRWERQSKNQTGNSSETKLESSHYKSRGSKASRKSPSPRKTDQKHSFNSQKIHSKDTSRKTSPRDKRTGKENKSSSSPSAGTDEHGKQCLPEKEKERAAKISTRKLSLSSRKDETNISERPHGKRRWGSSTKTISKPSLSISTDSLKDLIPDYKPIVKNVMVSSEELNTAANIPEEEPSYGQQEVNTQSADFTGIEETAATESALTKNDGQKDEVVRSPTPPQNPPSCVIHIRNLVRPFTLHQLKEFLKRTGTVVEGGFWIDKIKSKCYVTYETQEQAVETRHALHGTRWPLSNPKTLSVDFATKEELDFHKELPDVSKLQAKKEKTEDKKSTTSSSNTKKFDDEKKRERSDRTVQPIREWDRDKLTQDSPEHDWQSKEKSRDRGRSPDRRERKDKKDTKRKQEEETPAKLLDDLFRKTKAAPCIYWLPLTEEQIQLRVQDLRQRQLEREKRREQRDRQEKEKEEAERQQRQKARESRSGKEKESSQQSRSPSGRKR